MSTAAQCSNPQRRTTALTSHKATKPPRSGFPGSVSWWLESRLRDGRAPSTCPQPRSLPIRTPNHRAYLLQSRKGPVFRAPCLGGLNPVRGMGERHSLVHSYAVLHASIQLPACIPHQSTLVLKKIELTLRSFHTGVVFEAKTSVYSQFQPVFFDGPMAVACL